MARSAPVRAATRSLSWLGVIVVVLVAIIGGGVLWSDATWVPKLALDLEGGTQIVLAAQTTNGQAVTQDQLNQSVSIIRERVDAAGVSESEVSTQGGSNVVVTMAGTVDDQTMARIQSSARLTFRPVIYTAAQTNTSATATPTDASTDDPTASPTPEPADTRTATPTDASDPSWVTAKMLQDFDDFDCAQLNDPDYIANAADDEPFITCGENDGQKYILGPVEVTGETITDATAGLVPDSQGRATNVWGVFPVFNAEGTEEFATVTTRLYGYYAANPSDPRAQFAIVLDGRVISAPSSQAAITNGKPVISGSFTQDTAQTLADQLKFGALPISFTVQSKDTISATLGTAQLAAGLLAGLIGMILVLLYSLFQYRMLGFVTVASLILMGVLTYLAISIFSWQNGYRLSLAGVAGLIVSIGFTADSFIVYFERIRDELRDGKSLPGAVEAGWKRALRTILSAKFINLLSAVVLYVLAVGNVQGFAFTLGVTTVIDVIVVLLFTHPVMQLLAENRFFAGGHRFSGLDPNALGAVYRGRAEFRFSAEARRKGAGGKEAAHRQTIAERKAAELAAANSKNGEED